jgi:hypothetical protein
MNIQTTYVCNDVLGVSDLGHPFENFLKRKLRTNCQLLGQYVAYSVISPLVDFGRSLNATVCVSRTTYVVSLTKCELNSKGYIIFTSFWFILSLRCRIHVWELDSRTWISHSICLGLKLIMYLH